MDRYLKRKPLADKNEEGEDAAYSAAFAAGFAAGTAAAAKSSGPPAAKKPSTAPAKKVKEVPIRGRDADLTTLQLTKITTKKTKPVLSNLLKKMKLGRAVDKDHGCCAKEAIRKGFLNIEGTPDDLKKVVFKDVDISAGGGGCECKVDVTLEMLLKQPNYVGGDEDDYEDVGLEGATIFCEEHKEENGGWCRMSGLCEGNVTTGKFLNHCVKGKCSNGKEYGMCIGDSQNAHCTRCGGHYYAGGWGGGHGCAPNFTKGRRFVRFGRFW